MHNIIAKYRAYHNLILIRRRAQRTMSTGRPLSKMTSRLMWTRRLVRSYPFDPWLVSDEHHVAAVVIQFLQVRHGYLDVGNALECAEVH